MSDIEIYHQLAKMHHSHTQLICGLNSNALTIRATRIGRQFRNDR